MRLDTDPTAWAGVENVPAVSTGLGGLLDRYERDVAVTGVLTSFVTGGVTALAVLVLALTALLGAQRRDREVRLLRARGASRGQVLTLVGVATSVLAVPLAVLAALAVVLLVPGDTTSAAWVEVALVVVLPPLVAVVATARRVRAIDEVPEESTRTVRAARRIVLEAAVVLLAVLAVTTVRSRGAVIAAGRTDWYAAVTPVLVALAAAVVALRVMPWPVAWLAGIAERGRGFVAFVGLTRAARTGAGAAVPLAALVVGATLVTLMATLTASVSEQRELAALRAVGADARVDAARIDTADVAALAARPGVEAAIPAHVDAGATVSADGRVTSVVVVAVDPARYAELLEGTPLAFTPPGAPVDGRLPVVLSGGPAVGDLDLGLRGLSTPAHRVATVPAFSAPSPGRGEWLRWCRSTRSSRPCRPPSPTRSSSGRRPRPSAPSRPPPPVTARSSAASSPASRPSPGSAPASRTAPCPAWSPPPSSSVSCSPGCCPSSPSCSCSRQRGPSGPSWRSGSARWAFRTVASAASPGPRCCRSSPWGSSPAASSACSCPARSRPPSTSPPSPAPSPACRSSRTR